MRFRGMRSETSAVSFPPSLLSLHNRFRVDTVYKALLSQLIPVKLTSMNVARRWILPSRLATPLVFAATFFVLSTLLRTALLILFPPPSQVGLLDRFLTFVVGGLADATASLTLFLPLALVCGFMSARLWQKRFVKAVLAAGSFVLWIILSFLLIAEGFFFEEFQSRFNTVAIDYLLYPHEVFVNIWESYPVPLVILGTALLALGITLMGWKWSWSADRAPLPSRIGSLAWLSTAALLIVAMATADTRFSKERSINEIANNTLVSLFAAAATRNLDYAAFYPTVSPADAYERARRIVATPDTKFAHSSESLQRRVPGDAGKAKLNLVLLLEESLGSEFWGILGRKEPSLMPLMDALAGREGMVFENLYADGNRTIRGYEGVFSSFPPLPGDSIVARDRSENVETIARVLRRDDYDTTFIYAGRGVFDGTRTFATANGWSNFVELKDFKKPVFTTVWGVCNEDLYDRVLAECRDRHTRGLPFFMTSMSVSNHKPYTYPTGRIPEDPAERRRANVVKYTDYALNRFFEMAKKEPFWTNTIFAVVGDHGARVYGSQTIPIRSYEVPMILFGPAASPTHRRISTPGCQLDVAPTLLGLIGRPYDSCFFGRDLLKWPDIPGRALLHHNRSIGIYARNRLVVFNLNKQVEYFVGDPKQEQMQKVNEPDADHSTLRDDATALFQVADDLYMNRRFRIDESRLMKQSMSTTAE